MSLRYGKTEIKAMVEVLDADHQSVEDAALAALQAAEEVFLQRAAYTVVGQLWKEDNIELDPSDERAVKVALGWYSTRGDAEKAAAGLVFNNQTHDTYRVWTLPVTHCTGAEIHKAKKEKLIATEAKAREASRAKFQEQIKKYAAAREAATQRALEEMA